jgi:hypothetical protein
MMRFPVVIAVALSDLSDNPLGVFSTEIVSIPNGVEIFASIGFTPSVGQAVTLPEQVQPTGQVLDCSTGQVQVFPLFMQGAWQDGSTGHVTTSSEQMQPTGHCFSGHE